MRILAVYAGRKGRVGEYMARTALQGALDAGATDINEEMKIAAAEALAGLVSPEELNEEYTKEINNQFDQLKKNSNQKGYCR